MGILLDLRMIVTMKMQVITISIRTGQEYRGSLISDEGDHRG